jgi:hypothetical protein
MTGVVRHIRFLFVCCVVLALVAGTAFDVWARRRADAELVRLEKRFGSLGGRSIVAPPVAAADNSARFVSAAAALAVRPAPKSGYDTLDDAITHFDRLLGPSPVPEDVRTWLEANQEAIRLAGEAVPRHQASWDADYAGGGTLRLLDIRTLSNALYLAAILDLKAGHPDEASRNTAAGLAVAASLRHEPSMTSQLIRVGVAMQQCQAVKRLIARSEPSKTVLEELARALSENRQTDPMRVALRGELSFMKVVMVPNEGGPLDRMGRVESLRHLERLIDAEEGPRPRPRVPVPSGSWLRDPRHIASTLLSGLERTVTSGDTHNNGLAVAEVGVALRRYRLDRGSYPGDLSALVPAYLGRLPIDAMTGKPPVYLRSGAGFTLKASPVTPTGNVALEWVVGK